MLDILLFALMCYAWGVGTALIVYCSLSLALTLILALIGD